MIMRFQFRALLLSGTLALLGLQQLTAQTYEVFGGYTLGKMKPEEDVNLSKMSGWNTSFTAYPVSRFGLTADFAGYYGDAHPTVTGSEASGSTVNNPAVALRQYSFMAGPQVRLMRRSRFETSFKALFGGAHAYVPGSSVPSGMPDPFNATTFASMIGSNIDVKVSKKFALRFSPGTYITRFGGDTQMNFRFSVGPVFKFGGRS
jgi:hypothetical protein